MIKRILLTVMTILVIYTGILVGYRLNEPENAYENYTSEFFPTSLDYETLKEYTQSSGASTYHYYLFCTYESNDCLYLENTLLSTVETDTQLDVKSLLEYVDISGVPEEQRLSRLKNDWNLSNYPALLACHIENNQIIIDNTLEWDANHPYNTDDIKEWLFINGLYDDYENITIGS